MLISESQRVTYILQCLQLIYDSSCGLVLFYEGTMYTSLLMVTLN